VHWPEHSSSRPCDRQELRILGIGKSLGARCSRTSSRVPLGARVPCFTQRNNRQLLPGVLIVDPTVHASVRCLRRRGIDEVEAEALARPDDYANRTLVAVWETVSNRNRVPQPQQCHVGGIFRRPIPLRLHAHRPPRTRSVRHPGVDRMRADLSLEGCRPHTLL
jgi:hypothetical protein